MKKKLKTSCVSNEDMFMSYFGVEHINTEKDKDKNSQNELFKWRAEVWDNCPHKKEDDEKEGISFYCALIRKTCLFRNCPKFKQNI